MNPVQEGTAYTTFAAKSQRAGAIERAFQSGEHDDERGKPGLINQEVKSRKPSSRCDILGQQIATIAANDLVYTKNSVQNGEKGIFFWIFYRNHDDYRLSGDLVRLANHACGLADALRRPFISRSC